MGYALGAVEYLQKPVDRKELLRMAHHYADRPVGAHALIVEDDEPARFLMHKTLAESGWQVSEAENGAVALQRVAACIPDMILLDLMMPVMDGFEFVVELRKREDCRSIPIIVVTAKDLTKEERDRLNGAVERIVHKSTFTQEDLLQQIRNLAARYCER
jgi:CheY-like chemotaxis protein